MLFCAAIASIFLSTVDSLASAVGYLFSGDIKPSCRRILDRYPKRTITEDEKDYVIGVSRRATGIAVIGASLLFVGLSIAVDEKWGHAFVGLFLAFYGPLIAMSPSVLIPVVFGRSVKASYVLVSILGGSLLGISAGVFGIIVESDKWGYAAPIVALGFAWIVYLLGLLDRPRIVSTEE